MVFVVDIDAVLTVRPFEALAGATPRPEYGPVRVELDHRWRRYAAHTLFASLACVQRARTMDDPHVILRIDGHARYLSQDPVIGELSRPERINPEARGIVGSIARGDGVPPPVEPTIGRERHNQGQPVS